MKNYEKSRKVLLFEKCHYQIFIGPLKLKSIFTYNLILNYPILKNMLMRAALKTIKSHKSVNCSLIIRLFVAAISNLDSLNSILVQYQVLKKVMKLEFCR